MKQYIKDNKIKTREEITITTDSSLIVNPTEEEILNNGWTEYIPPKPSEPTGEELIEQAKQELLYDIERYDKSDNVNSFILQGQQLWLDREMRRTVRERCEMDLKDGIVVSNLSIGKFVFPVPPQKGLDMLHALERYAIQCFDNTQQHYRNAENNQWKSEEEIKTYDYKTGYPPLLNFDVLSI